MISSKLLAGTLALVLFTGIVSPAFAGVPMVVPTSGDMWGSTAHSTPNQGEIAIVSQIDGSQSLIGDPTLDGSIAGLAFDSTGMLWGSNNFNGPISNLIKINPTTGALISSIPITINQDPAGIQDLAVQPGTDILYGTTHIRDPNFTPEGEKVALVTIDKTTGVLTLVGLIDTNPTDTIPSPATHGIIGDRIPIAFAPDGTLYGHSHNFRSLVTLDPDNADVLTADSTGSLTTATGLGVRNDGTIFASDLTEIYTIATNGAVTVLGSPGPDDIADLAFIPEPTIVGGEFLSIDSTALILAGIQSSAIWMLPVLAGAGGAGIAAFKLRRK